MVCSWRFVAGSGCYGVPAFLVDLLSVCLAGLLKVFVSICIFRVVAKSVGAGLFTAEFPLAGFFLKVSVSDVFLVVDVSAFTGALQGGYVCSMFAWT